MGNKLPVLLLALGAAGLGTYLLTLYFQGARKPMLIGLHLILGIGALEMMVLIAKDFGGEAGPGSLANFATGCLALAVFIGLLRPVIRQRYPNAANPLLALHVGCGAAGAVSTLVWGFV